MLWIPVYKMEIVLLLTSMVDVKVKQDGAQHVAYLTSTQQTLTLLFLNQHLAPVEVIPKGSLALLLNGQLIPRKEGAGERVLPASFLPPLFNFLPSLPPILPGGFHTCRK